MPPTADAAPIEIEDLSASTVADLAALMTRAFSDYIAGPAHMDEGRMRDFLLAGGSVPQLGLLARQSGGRPVAFAAVGQHGTCRRVAGMGIVPEARRTGLGTALLTRLLDRARQDSCTEVQLEVFEQNTPAVTLYRRTGFQVVRRLHAWKASPQEPHAPCRRDHLERITREAAAALPGCTTFPDFPWQVSPLGASLAPTTAVYFRWKDTAVGVMNLDGDSPALRTVFVRAKPLLDELASLLAALRAAFPGKTWIAPALWPEELGPAFVRAGFTVGPLNQWQMTLRL